MADTKFSALTAAGALDGTEVVPVVKGGVPRRTTVADIAAEHTDAVTSVNSATGVVVLTQDDVGDGTTYKQYSATEKTKLAGIATAATANDTDANLKARANHTGTQTLSTISDAGTLAAKSGSGFATITVGTSAPGTPATGDIWIDTN